MKLSKLLVNIYGLLFILIVFAGSETNGGILFKYPAEMFAILCCIMLIGVKYSKKYFYLSNQKLYFVFFAMMLIYIIYSYFTNSYYKLGTKVYIIRYFFYMLSTLVIISPEVIIKLYNIAKKYIIAVAIIFLILYSFKGVNGSFLGSYQNVANVICKGIIIYFVDFFCDTNFKSRKIFALLLLFLTLFMTGKRSFLLISILIFGCFMIMNNKKNMIKRLFRIGVPFFVCIILVVIIKPDLLYSLQRFMNTSSDETLSGRLYLWKLALYHWENHKLTGIGLGTFTKYIENNLSFTYTHFGVQRAYAPHNIYIQLLAETGTIGFIIWNSFFVVSVINSFRMLKFKWVKESTIYRKTIYCAIGFQLWFLIYGLSGNALSVIGQLYTFIFATVSVQGVMIHHQKQVFSEEN